MGVGDELIALELSSSAFAERDRTEAFHQVYGREILKLDIEPLQETTLQIDMAAARAKYRPMLHDDERQRARSAPGQSRPAVQPGSAPPVRTGTEGSGR